MDIFFTQVSAHDDTWTSPKNYLIQLSHYRHEETDKLIDLSSYTTSYMEQIWQLSYQILTNFRWFLCYLMSNNIFQCQELYLMTIIIIYDDD